MPAPVSDVAPDPDSLPRRLDGLIEAGAATAPDRTALVDWTGEPVSWCDLAGRIAATADRLAATGVRPGDRVMVVAENGAAMLAGVFAASRLDAWSVPVNARLTAAELARIRDHATPRAILYTVDVSPDARAHAEAQGAMIAGEGPLASLAILGGLPATPEPTFEDNDRQVATLLYTSGTTGEPKGVMLTHRNLLYAARVSAMARGLNPADRVYAVLPITHVFGLTSMSLSSLTVGARLELVPRFDPAHLAAALASGVSVVQATPPMIARLLDHLEATGQSLKAPGLRYLACGGAPLDIDWKRRMEARFGVRLNNGYGLTETSPTVAITRIHAPRDDDSIGTELPGIAVRFTGEGDVPVPDGTVGELQVKAPTVMAGYHRAPSATHAVMTADGWLRTGDLGRRAGDGALFLTGRKKELIIRGGFNVYPIDVEAALNAHPAVVQSAVIGRPVKGDEEVVAFVELTPGTSATIEDIRAFAAERLAPYKRPRHLFVVERMPAAPTGKIQKHRLVPLAETLIAGQDP